MKNADRVVFLLVLFFLTALPWIVLQYLPESRL
jgi:hypothetical protein